MTRTRERISYHDREILEPFYPPIRIEFDARKNFQRRIDVDKRLSDGKKEITIIGTTC